jgi:primosomal protein N' (replication factor Y)
LEYIIQHDYQGFYKQEIIEREKFAYPPFYKLIRLTLKHKEIELLDMGAHSLSSQLKRIFKERVLGPEYPLIKKIQNKYLKEILIKFERTIEEQQVKRLIKEQINTFYSSSTFKPIQISIDVDPI